MNAPMTELTRQVMWNVPKSVEVLMYVSFVISVIIFTYSIYKKLSFLGGFKTLLAEIKKDQNIQAFFKTALYQERLFKRPLLGLFHAFFFNGFLILFITTSVVAIHYDTPIKIFHGPLYAILSFLSDFAGAFILVGLGIATIRRFVIRPKNLATNHRPELFMYSFIALFVIVGFLLEAIRIYETGFPTFEKACSPVGWILAHLIGSLGLSSSAHQSFHLTLWIFHTIQTMVFIATLPLTKFSHIFWGPLNALVTNRSEVSVLKPMDFSNEDAEHFGLQSLSEVTFNNKVDFEACVECGRCTDSCPANLAGKNLDPRSVITKLRDFFRVSFKKDEPTKNLWDAEIFGENEIEACTTCGACHEACPMSISHIPLIMEAKRYKALTLGELPPGAQTAVGNIQNNANPWGIAKSSRFDWAKDLDLPIIEAGKKVDYLFYIGCAGNYDPSARQVTLDVLKILQKADVSFAVLGKKEPCCGDAVRRFGDEYTFQEMAMENIELFNQYEFDHILVTCPHGLHTIGKEYGKMDDGKFRVVHHTELIADLLKQNRISLTKEIDGTVSFHDPCYLGRHHGNYDSAREILNAIPGLKIKELETSKNEALCCGMGGGNMWYELPEGKHLALNRLEQIEKGQSEKVATACPYCMINFNSTKTQTENIKEIPIHDIASLVVQSL